jgi:hypothetical protein
LFALRGVFGVRDVRNDESRSPVFRGAYLKAFIIYTGEIGWQQFGRARKPAARASVRVQFSRASQAEQPPTEWRTASPRQRLLQQKNPSTLSLEPPATVSKSRFLLCVFTQIARSFSRELQKLFASSRLMHSDMRAKFGPGGGGAKRRKFHLGR